MAYEVPGFVYSEWWDGVAATIPQFSVVRLTADTLALVAADGDMIHGVVQMPCTIGQAEQVRVMKSGISFVRAGGDATRGNYLRANDDGTVENAAGGNEQIGLCLQTAVAGEITCMLLGYFGEA